MLFRSFIEQQSGQLFRDIAIAISAGVGLSLLISVTVIPSLSARILTTRQKSHEVSTNQEAVTEWSDEAALSTAAPGPRTYGLADHVGSMVDRKSVV